MEKGAIISECEKYRYQLWRIWDRDLPFVAFIMLNPSTADANNDDPTIRRCINFCKDWGYGGLYVANLFAYRATNPKKLKEVFYPIGSDNNKHILDVSNKVEKLIAAWGTNGIFLRRHHTIKQLLNGKLYYLELSKSGIPKHPLYLKSELTPKLWNN